MPENTERLKTALADRYAIERELGAGGMATVYLAHDVRHDRKVALKVLRPELSAILGGERFLAEIKTTANLQHPHILSLFDSGEADGLVYYVMPYVEGESLRDRLNREKQLPVEEAVGIAREVADALEYAHGQRIVHRDIKPENILLHGGHALVADFGIALAASRSDGGTRMTETGMSLGTPHYMAPEQAMGEKEITPKADIYALGCVLYEMLTAEPPFVGATAQAIIARVMTEEPRSLTLQRKTIPPHVEAVVRRALQKLPADRFASAAQFAEALAHPEFMQTAAATALAPSGAAGGARTWRRRATTVLPWVLFCLATLAAVWLGLAPVPAVVSRYSIALAEGQGMQAGQGPRLAISPDGSRFVYVGPGDGGGRLWVRDRDRLEARPIAGTEGAISPFFSPDGQRVGFYTITPLRLKVVSLTGEPPVTVADSGIDWDGGSWGPDGYIYSDGPTGLVRVRPGGGPVEQVSRPDTSLGEDSHNYPDVLPNGRGAVFAIWRRGVNLTESGIGVVDFRTGRHSTLVNGVYARYLSGGYLVYVTGDGTLLVAPFDEDGLRLTGPGTALAEGVNIRAFGYVDLAVSLTGTLVYLSGSASVAPFDLLWMRRDGSTEVVDSGVFDAPVLSPDGRRLAASVVQRGEQQIWVKSLPTGPLSKLTFEGSQTFRPAWTPDGQSLTYVSGRSGRRQLWTQRADGSAPAVLQLSRPREILEGEWSRDGRWLVFREGSVPVADIMAVQPGTDTTPVEIVATRFNERSPALSPDARFIAYVSDESGQSEVYVRPFPDAARARWQVSLHGGSEPLWAHNGRELFYRDPSGSLVSAEVAAQPVFTVGRQTVLFPLSDFAADDSHREYDVSPDGRRFLLIRQRGGGERANLIVVENWFAELKRKLARR